MPVHKSSRYLRQPRISVDDGSGTTRRVYEQRDTTVFEDERPRGTVLATLAPSEDMADLARRGLGRPAWWWIVADHNPLVFYPLDAVDGEQLYVPPASSLNRFRRR